MTPRGRPLSENGKVIAICLIVPLLWPFLPVVLLCMLGDKIRVGFWGWRYRRAERRSESHSNGHHQSEAK